jgi:2-methylisocitrate lyase-like PEP mutase family enzyme
MSESSDLVARARLLRELHAGPDLLVLPNVWDAATARTVAAAGFPAVATSSGAVALSLGYADHEQAPPDEMLAAIARVVRAVDVPVTADVESGYGWPATELVDRLAAAGAVGCNLEDTDHAAGGLRDAEAQAGRIAAVRDALAASGTDLVVNARVDTFLHPAEPSAQLDEGIRRAVRYLEAGADCVYPITLADEGALRTFVDAVRPAPVNVMATPALPPFDTLRGIGVRRISLAGGVFRAVQRFVGEVAAAAAAGDTSRLFER